MKSKALKNESLRTKFTVGARVHLPRNVWTRCTSKLINHSLVEHEVVEVGDRVIEHHGNKLCRFAIVLGKGSTVMFEGLAIWEEWMLEKITVL